MENKKSEAKVRLRLVKTSESDLPSQETDVKPPVRFRSAFAQSMNNFADELDQMIENVKRI